ncbi:MAG: hypothetical protein KUG65_10335 [Sphingomonadaceae bacterium]|nr:hypothetical protein [Sphingomonadaceae bacterium]
MLASLLMAGGLFAAAPASASYMSNCNELISAWKVCKAGGGACVTEHKSIAAQCKCHRLRQGEWKLVMSAVGKDGVCAPRPPEDPSPPPHDRRDGGRSFIDGSQYGQTRD